MPQLSGTVSLSAEPAPGSKFVEWRGACRGSENPCLVEVDQELQVEAVFEALPRFDVRLDDGARTSESRPAVAAAVPPQPTPAFSPTRAKSGCKLNVKTRDSGNQRLAYRRCECPGVPAMYSRIGLRIEKNLEDQRELLARTQGLELPEGWRCER